jgi:uncharacterized surface anchored protein
MNGLALALLLLQGTSSIDGVVVRASDKRPVAQTQIVAVPVGGPLKDSRIATTDAAGRFNINGFPPGSYRLFFEHDGFVRAEYGQGAPGKSGVPIEIAAGKSVSGITVPLTATAAIHGRVINGSNDPVINATVKALKPTYVDGERSLQGIQSVRTNDLGEYRLSGLIPGTYFLSVTPIASPYIQAGTLTTPSGSGFSVQQLQSFLTTGNFIDPRAFENLTEVTIYAPGTTDPATASAIDLIPDTSYRAPDLRTTRTRSYGIRGQIVDEAGQPANAVNTTLRRLNSNETVRSNLMSSNRSAFEFSGILPGTYELSAADNAVTAEKVGALTVTVGNENVDNLRLVLRPVIQVKGRIQHVGSAVPTSLRVQLRGTRGGSGVQITPTAADGAFTVTRLTPGDYRLALVDLPANLHVRSARLGTTDVLNSTIRIEGAISEQLEIVLAPNTGSLDAVVVDRNKQPIGAATVVLVPESDRRQRYELYRTAATDSSGRATLTNVAPGNYKLFAWQDIEPNAWQNAEAMRPFEDHGVVMSVGENAKVSQTVTVIE